MAAYYMRKGDQKRTKLFGHKIISEKCILSLRDDGDGDGVEVDSDLVLF